MRLAVLRCAPRLIACMLIACTLIAEAWSQSTLTPPQSAHLGLTIMSQVVLESDSLIAAHSYDQLPQQSAQFERGLTALQQGLSIQTPERRQQLSPLLAKARVASSAMSEAAKTRNDAMLKLTHDQLAAIVKALVQAFPPELQPSPGAAPP